MGRLGPQRPASSERLQLSRAACLEWSHQLNTRINKRPIDRAPRDAPKPPNSGGFLRLDFGRLLEPHTTGLDQDSLIQERQASACRHYSRAGTYTVKVVGQASPKGEGLDVPIRFVRHDRVGAIKYGDIVSGNIEQYAAHDRYTFTAAPAT